MEHELRLFGTKDSKGNSPLGKTPLQGFVQAVREERSSRLLARFSSPGGHLAAVRSGDAHILWYLRSRSWCVYGALSGGLESLVMKRRRRPRKLVPDAELIRRRAAGEPLRELASDYDVVHTTLGRYFERPEVAKQLRQAAKQLRAEQRAVAA